MRDDWRKNDEGDGEYLQVQGKCVAAWRKLEGVSLDGYFAGVYTPSVETSGRFATAAKAKSWCREMVKRGNS